jgi:ankyrin repeat protein
VAKLSDIFNKKASGARAVGTPLSHAVNNGDLDMVKKLLEAGTDPNLQQSDDPQEADIPDDDISVLKPAKVRRRTPEEREIALVRPVKIKNRTRDHA